MEVIERLPPLVNVKGVRSFLGHVGFYRRFIKDFSKIAKPLTQLLLQEPLFIFTDECLSAFEQIKQVPIIRSPDWDLPFEIMCDQRKDKIRRLLNRSIQARYKKAIWTKELVL